MELIHHRRSDELSARHILSAKTATSTRASNPFLSIIVRWAMRALISTSSRYSRGLNILLARHSSTVASISRSKAPAHIFYSQSSDPWLNLSIEHYIFQNAPARSRILLFYTNRPCVVIGRNQNPWLEVNLKLLETGILDFASNARILKGVDLVRRRSGGGTVFHDEGNVNWGVICDLGEFSRDKHAEMVVRGLRRLGVDRARVNERHDVVVDQGEKTQPVDGNDAHSTAYNALSPNLPSLKVSGSAYKIARNRALHHGTALVASDNLSVISQFLHSPAKSRITAKGVESVSSPIANIGISNRAFEEAVEKEFRRMYGLDPNHVTSSIVGEECLEIKDIENGYKELKVCQNEPSTTPSLY
jgi:lipoate-protein ligase A